MKLLLTSGGVTNTSIHDALVNQLGKPIADSTALCIPTAMYGHPMAGPGAKAWQFISGNSENPMVDLGWKSVGVLELTALPSIDEERYPWSERRTCCRRRAAMLSTCAIGCGSPGWRNCFRR